MHISLGIRVMPRIKVRCSSLNLVLKVRHLIQTCHSGQPFLQSEETKRDDS